MYCIIVPKDRRTTCSRARDSADRRRREKENEFKNKSNSLASIPRGLIDEPLNRQRRRHSGFYFDNGRGDEKDSKRNFVGILFCFVFRVFFFFFSMLVSSRPVAEPERFAGRLADMYLVAPIHAMISVSVGNNCTRRIHNTGCAHAMTENSSSVWLLYTFWNEIGD